MRKIVECVANFSEGRREDVVEKIVNSIRSVSGISMLGYESDADHNRSVVTFVGSPDVIVDAAFAGIKTAAELIDLKVHTGEHPRLGATDVVPFIPIEGVTMDDCVQLAHDLGKRVGEELNIPVYLYEKAATRPDRENLAKVRKGQYEKLKEEIGTNPDRKPDYGPESIGKAGATIIGARAPLVAYNVYLTTDNAEIAKKIGKAVRNSSGGFRSVKGLGMLVDGKAQVSMNLTDYTDTPIYRVVEMIRREAARYGVNIESSELIGLIPQQALFDAAQWYLQLDNFTPDMVLESRLQAPEQPDFLEALASSDPTSGGGSAAAYSGAMGAGLVAMVARVTIGKKKYADVQHRMEAIIAEADTLRVKLQSGVQADSAAFGRVMDAFRLPKSTDEEKTTRSNAIQAATLHAAEVPLETVAIAVRVLELAAEVAETGNVNAVSDAGSAGAMSTACIHAAGMNVKINAASLKDDRAVEELLSKLNEYEAQAKGYAERLHQAIHERGGI